MSTKSSARRLTAITDLLVDVELRRAVAACPQTHVSAEVLLSVAREAFGRLSPAERARFILLEDALARLVAAGRSFADLPAARRTEINELFDKLVGAIPGPPREEPYPHER